MITLPISLYFILCECSKWQVTLGKRKMGICVVDAFGHRISIGRSALRTAVKFLPWEIAHFGIWRLMLPSSLSEITVYIILNAVNLVILTYLIIPFTNKKRKMFMIGLQVRKWFIRISCVAFNKIVALPLSGHFVEEICVRIVPSYVV